MSKTLQRIDLGLVTYFVVGSVIVFGWPWITGDGVPQVDAVIETALSRW